MAKVRKFADAGSIGRSANKEAMTGIDDILKSAPGMIQSDGKAEAELKAATAPKKAQSFSEAFRAARNSSGAGKTFTWLGKSYSTNMAGEGAKKTTGRSGTAPASKASAPAPASKASAPAPASKASAPAVNPAFFKKREGAPTGAAGVKAPTPKAEAPKPKGRAGIAAASKVETPKPRIPAANLGPKKVDWSKANKPSANAPVKRAEPPKPKPGSLLLKRDEPKKDTVKFPLKRAKGGSIDGIAQRGKTRAPLKKGK